MHPSGSVLRNKGVSHEIRPCGRLAGKPEATERSGMFGSAWRALADLRHANALPPCDSAYIDSGIRWAPTISDSTQLFVCSCSADEGLQ